MERRPAAALVAMQCSGSAGVICVVHNSVIADGLPQRRYWLGAARAVTASLQDQRS